MIGEKNREGERYRVRGRERTKKKKRKEEKDRWKEWKKDVVRERGT